jgi:hypothetical protein
MREPWLFWGSLPFLLLAGVCFLVALRAISDRSRHGWEIATHIIAGAAATLMGYEVAFRNSAKSIPDLQINTSVGLLLLLFGVISLGTAVAKAFGK